MTLTDEEVRLRGCAFNETRSNFSTRSTATCVGAVEFDRKLRLWQCEKHSKEGEDMSATQILKRRQEIRLVVVGEAAVKRQYSGGFILPDAVEISYERNQQFGWHLRKIRIEGSTPKKDGTASRQFVDETWYRDPARRNSMLELPEWVMALAELYAPEGAEPLPSLDKAP